MVPGHQVFADVKTTRDDLSRTSVKRSLTQSLSRTWSALTKSNSVVDPLPGISTFGLAMRSQKTFKMKRVGPEALPLALYKRSPKAVTILLNRFEISRGFDGENSFVRYNYALKDVTEESRRKWYHYLLTRDARSAILQILDSRNTSILKNESIQSMLNAFWDNSIRRYVWFECIVFVLFLICSW